MKLIITGASGFVGSELVRQSLKTPGITSVIAIARKPLSPPSDSDSSIDTSKFHAVKIDDYSIYTDEVKEQLADADACIWTVAITPSKSSAYSDEELRKICHDNTLTGMQAMLEANKTRQSTTPFRFLYMSGIAAERDQTKTPGWKAKYSLMRGETENSVLDFAAKQNGRVEACAAKPGLITKPDSIVDDLKAGAIKLSMGVPSVSVTEISAAMIQQVIHGFEKEPLLNDDLVRIGKKALSG